MPTARASSYASLKGLALRFQNRRGQQCNLLALFEAAQHFGIVKIADSNAYRPR